MRSTTYALFEDAILAGQQVICTYDGHHREICPHIIGLNKDGKEAVLAWQFAGGSKGGLPPGGQWRCLILANVRNARVRDGVWHTGPYHQATQTCVTDIYLDINEPAHRQEW